MGSKRVGLARLEALIENLKREINLNGATLVGQRRAVKAFTSNATTDVLEIEDSGKIIFVDASTASVTHNISLPTPVGNEGLEYIIVLSAAAHSGTKVLVDSLIATGIKGFLKVLAGSGIANTLAHSNRKLGFGNSANLGSTIHLVSDGNVYHVVEAVSNEAFVTS